MSKTFRKMNTVVTLLISTEVVTDDETNQTEVTLNNVGNTVMATVIAAEGAAETTLDFKNAVATVATKAGLAFMLNDIEGKHEAKPPTTNQPGANA